MKHNIALLLLGVFASSTSFVFIRESTEAPVMLAAYRVLLTSILLSPLFIRDVVKTYSGTLLHLIKLAFLPGIILGMHFILWVIGARMTPGANATLIVSLVPLVMPVFMWMMYQEKVSRREIMATAIALLGMVLLSAGDFSVSTEYLLGDLVCFLSMILFGLYLAFARGSSRLPSIWLYLVPLYFIAGVFCFIVALFYSSPIHAYSSYELINIFALAVIPTIIGHSLLNYSMQNFRGQTVSLVNMGQFIFAGIIAYYLYIEVPTLEFWLASLLFLLSVGLVFWKKATTW